MNDSLQNNIHLEAKRSAVLFLDELGMNDFLGPSIESFVELKKINLIYGRINDGDAEGFSARKQDEKFIFINSNFNLRLQKFTIAHEIYHLEDEIKPLNNYLADERAADHFAANILLPDKIVFEKYRLLNEWHYSEIEVFFAISDLAQVPYETLYKRYKELRIRTGKLDEALKSVTFDKKDLYLNELEQKFQLLRKNQMVESSELDQPTYKEGFRKLETLVHYFSNQEQLGQGNE